MIQVTWFILGVGATLVALLGLGWREHVKERRRAPGGNPRPLTACRTWEETFNSDGTVFLSLKLTMSDGKKECSGTVSVDIPPGPLARDVRARILQRRSDLVESCLGWDMRSPEVVEFAGQPKRKEKT